MFATTMARGTLREGFWVSSAMLIEYQLRNGVLLTRHTVRKRPMCQKKCHQTSRSGCWRTHHSARDRSVLPSQKVHIRLRAPP